MYKNISFLRNGCRGAEGRRCRASAGRVIAICGGMRPRAIVPPCKDYILAITPVLTLGIVLRDNNYSLHVWTRIHRSTITKLSLVAHNVGYYWRI